MSNVIQLVETQIYTPAKVQLLTLSVLSLLNDRKPGTDFACKCYQRSNKWFLKVTTTQAERTNFLIGTESALVQWTVATQFKYATITNHTNDSITFLIGICKKFESARQVTRRQRDAQSSLRATIGKAVHHQAFQLDIADDVELMSQLTDVVADAVLAKYKVIPK